MTYLFFWLWCLAMLYLLGTGAFLFRWMERGTPEEDRKKAGAWNGSIHQKNIKETSKDSESMIQNP